MKVIKITVAYILAWIFTCTIFAGCSPSQQPVGDEGLLTKVYFSHYRGIQNFVSSYSNGEKKGEDYQIDSLASEDSLEEAVTNLTSIRIPKFNGDQYGMVMGEYFLDDYKEQLALRIFVGDIRYNFNYFFFDTKHSKMEGKLVVKNASIGEYTVDLYEDNNRISGRFKMGKTYVYVSVWTDDVKELQLDKFEFVQLVK